MPTTEGEQQGPAPEDAEPAQELAAATSSRLLTAELEDLVDAALSRRELQELPEPDPYVGLEIDRRYVIESLIAAGGMGLVYRCRHSVLGKRLAIKIIRGDVAQMPDGTDRFLLEAKAASAIGHEHIVDIADFGALPDGSPYLVMEYLDGISLAALLRDEPDLGVSRIAWIATQIAEGLGAAHAAGIVHRDLKPDNVFVLERKGEDFIKILDFGVARMAQNAKKLTQAGTIVGTPHYMSPEQALGLEVDHRGDIYALGVILYELLARRVPFDGSHYVAVLNQHLHALPPPFSSLDPPVVIPAALDRIVSRCLAKSPADRFETMAELSRALAPFRDDEEPAPSTASDDTALRASDDLLGAPEAASNAPGQATAKLPHPLASDAAYGILPASLSSDGASLENPRARSDSAPSSSLSRLGGDAPTAALPAATPTLVWPRPSGLFSVQQKRLVTGFSVLVLIGVCAAAAFRLGSSRGRSATAPVPPAEPSEPAVIRESVVRPTPMTPAVQPPSAPPSNAPSAQQPAAPALQSPSRSSSASATPPTIEPSNPVPSSGSAGSGPLTHPGPPKDIGKAERDREHRAPATPKRPEGTRSAPAGKPRTKDDFMNPWPSPR